MKIDHIFLRAQLKELFGPCVYRNMIGFIKVNEQLDYKNIALDKADNYNWLDFTRVHPDHYFIALQMAKDLIEENIQNNNH